MVNDKREGRPQKGAVLKLSARQEKFCQEYLVDRNATAAYIRAGYAAKSANSAAGLTMRKPHVKRRINELVNKQNHNTAVDAKYVLSRLYEIDQLDILDIMDEEMENFKPLSQWPKTWRISINAIDIKRIVESRKDGSKVSVETIIEKIKWPDKTRNLELLGKHVSVKAFEGELGSTDDKPVVIKFVRAVKPEPK